MDYNIHIYYYNTISLDYSYSSAVVDSYSSTIVDSLSTVIDSYCSIKVVDSSYSITRIYCD